MITIVQSKTLYSDLVCSKSGVDYDKDRLQTYSKLNKPLLAHYDLSVPLDRRILRKRPKNIWRYRELLPVEHDENIFTLGEGGTPLIRLDQAGRYWGLRHLYLKDESQNPTGSFKARGLAMAVSKAKELGVQKCVIPTAGNAGGAMSAYCAMAGLEAYIYMPKLTPKVFSKECEMYGAKVILVDGDISDCARRVAEEREPDWFDLSTLKEPFRLEGKKTMGFEIAEQFGWELPDVIVYPTGGGTGLIGIWKAFQELEQLRWITGKKPRMVAVQTEACCPIVKAFEAGESAAAPFRNPGETIANGLRVPAAFGDELILDILYKSQGCAVAVSEADIEDGLHEAALYEGKLLAPEGAATWMAARRLMDEGWIEPKERVVLLNTGSFYKYVENLIG
jgi:threonine synthase